MDDLRLESEPETSALNQVFKLEGKLPVSYTHLTLPTKA